MVINKDPIAAQSVSLQLSHYGKGSGTAQRWQLTAANQITALSSQTYTGSQVNDTLPAQSITLYVIH
jgi:hypothetical protein